MSVMSIGPLLGIEGPLPLAPAYNLLRYAIALDGNWFNGITMRAFPDEGARGFDPCSTGTDRAKDDSNDAPIATFVPFTAYVPEACSSLGVGPWDDFKARANSVLTATEAMAAEIQLATGA